MRWVFALATVAALALGACVATGPAASEELAPPIETNAMSEKCEAWLAWLVDGNPPVRVIGVHILVTVEIAQECLGRNPNPYKKSPFPLEREAPAPEPTPDPPPVPDMPKAEKVET